MTKTRFAIVTAAALTVGSLSFSSIHAQVREVPPDTQRKTGATGTDTNRAGMNPAADGMNRSDQAKMNYDKSAASMAPDAEGIRNVLSQLPEASLTVGGFDDLVERFVDADRNRMGRDGFAEKDQPELDRLAKSLGDAWKAKYNQAFDMDEEKVFAAGFATIKQSEIGRQGMSGSDQMGDRSAQTSQKLDPSGNTNTRTDTAADTGAEVTTKRDGTMSGPTGTQGGVDMTAAADQQRRNETDRTAAPGTGAPDRTTGADASRAATDMDGNRSVVTGQVAPDAASGRTAAESTRTGLNTPSPVAGNNATGGAVGNTGTDGNTAADRNTDDVGRNIAVVTLVASHGLPELKVNMIHEAPGVWKIDVPDAVDGPRLQQNLIAHLNACLKMQSEWPADVNDAYRAVSHHVLMAIMNKPADMAASTN